MAKSLQTSGHGSTITVRVPLSIRKRGGRKVIVSPEGADTSPQPHRSSVDGTLLKAVVRAFHWKRQLEGGRYATVSDLAAAEQLDRSFVAHVLRLTLLSPTIIEAILDGRQAATMQLQPLMRGVPAEWGDR